MACFHLKFRTSVRYKNEIIKMRIWIKFLIRGQVYSVCWGKIMISYQRVAMVELQDGGMTFDKR